MDAAFPGRCELGCDGVRDDLCDYVGHLGHHGAVLVVDKPGTRKGRLLAGVQRQYTGTAGRVENAQVAAFLTYAAPAGHALIDREFCLTKPWTAGPLPGGRHPPQVPALRPSRSCPGHDRPRLDAGVPAAWVTGDEVYGTDPGLRTDAESRRIGFVLVFARTNHVTTSAGPCPAGQIAGIRWTTEEQPPGQQGIDWAG
jgi:SRSO17 transposase